MDKKYRDLFDEFIYKTKINVWRQVKDYKPCEQPYFRINIPGAIVVILDDGSKIVYIPEEE